MLTRRFPSAKDLSSQIDLSSSLRGAEIVTAHCSPDDLKLTDSSLRIFKVDVCPHEKEQTAKHPIADFLEFTTTDFCKAQWRWKLFHSALRECINELFEKKEIERLSKILVAPQSAYHPSNINSQLTAGKISRWTHLLDTFLNSASQVWHHAKADRAAEVGGKPTVKDGLLQCLAALLHDAAVYEFSHTGENYLRSQGIPADHDAILLMLIVPLSKSGVFERMGLTKEEVMGAVFPPHFVDVFLGAESSAELNKLKTTLNYWKSAVPNIDDRDIDDIIDLQHNGELIRQVSKYKGIARYVHNCLDNISYIPTDQGHHSREEMLALMSCTHGEYKLSPNARLVTEDETAMLPKSVTKQFDKRREYFIDSKLIPIGDKEKVIYFIVESRRDGMFNAQPFHLPIFIKEQEKASDWTSVRVGKTLFSKAVCLRTTWASIDGNHDVVTSSVDGFYRIIKSQFYFARRKVSDLNAALSVGLINKILNSIAFDPLDFLRLSDSKFIRKYFPVPQARLFVSPSELDAVQSLPRGFNANLKLILGLQPKTTVDWFHENLDRESVSRIVTKLNETIEAWKQHHKIPATSDCFAAIATSIFKEFDVRVVDVPEGTAFNFLKVKSKKGTLERISDTLFLKPILKRDDAFSTILKVGPESFEGTHKKDFDFRLEEKLFGSIAVCVDKSLMTGGRNSQVQERRRVAIQGLTNDLLRIIKDARVTVESFQGEKSERPLLDFYEFAKVGKPQRKNLKP